MLDDGLSGMPAEDTDGAHRRFRPDSDPASLNRGGTVLQGNVSHELTLPVRVDGIGQASHELPQRKRGVLGPLREHRPLREHAISENTRRNYQSQWRRFQRWTKERSVECLPADPAHVIIYIEERYYEGCSTATLRASLSAISYLHRVAKEDDPCRDTDVRGTMSGATRLRGRTQKQAPALTREAFERIRKTACSPRIGKGGHIEREETARERGRLDIAIIGMMRDGLLRVSEAADTVWSDIWDGPDGSGRLLIPRSKTDVDSSGFVAYLSADTMFCLDRIRDGASDTDRVIGLASNQIAKRIKRAAQQAGLGDRFSGHSCRVGMARDLAGGNFSLARIMQVGRWTTAQMAAFYIRNEAAARNAVAEYHGHRPRLS